VRRPGPWRKLHKEKLCNFFSPHIIRKIKSKRMREIGHVAHMGKINAYKTLVGKPERRNHFEDLGIGGG
jgi:hypothetical protein